MSELSSARRLLEAMERAGREPEQAWVVEIVSEALEELYVPRLIRAQLDACWGEGGFKRGKAISIARDHLARLERARLEELTTERTPT